MSYEFGLSSFSTRQLYDEIVRRGREARRTIEIAEKAVGHMKGQAVSKDLAAEEMGKIVSRVSERFQVDSKALLGAGRKKPLVTARHVAIYVCRKLVMTHLLEMARFFGKDHSSILHAEKTVSEQMKFDARLQESVAFLLKEAKQSCH